MHSRLRPAEPSQSEFKGASPVATMKDRMAVDPAMRVHGPGLWSSIAATGTSGWEVVLTLQVVQGNRAVKGVYRRRGFEFYERTVRTSCSCVGSP